MSDYYFRKWVPAPSDGLDEGGADIVVWDHVLADVQEHAASDLANEVGGFLLGHTMTLPDQPEPLVFVEARIAAQHVNATPSSVEFTHDTWNAFHAEREVRFGDMQVVGWYHTHPNWGIFLSVYDTFIHENFFKESHRIALVVDPVREQAGFFKLVDGALDPRRHYGFTELSRSPEPALQLGGNLRLALAPVPLRAVAHADEPVRVRVAAPPWRERYPAPAAWLERSAEAVTAAWRSLADARTWPALAERTRAAADALARQARAGRSRGAALVAEVRPAAARARARAADLWAASRPAVARLGERARARAVDLWVASRPAVAHLGERARAAYSELATAVRPAATRLRDRVSALAAEARPVATRVQSRLADLRVAVGPAVARLRERVSRALGRRR